MKLSPGWALAISDVTFFEILNEIPKNKEAKALSELNKFPRFEVSQEMLMTAARLGCLYRDHNAELGITDKPPEMGDKIIAATALLSQGGGLVFTMNMRDYPAPFFKEYIRYTFAYDSKKRGAVHDTVYFMEPQAQLISDHTAKRDAIKESKEKSITIKKQLAAKKKMAKKESQKKTAAALKKVLSIE